VTFFMMFVIATLPTTSDVVPLFTAFFTDV